MSWQVEYPILTTWLDLRPYHGVNLGPTSNWQFNTNYSFCYSPCSLWNSSIWKSSGYRVVNAGESIFLGHNYFCKNTTDNATAAWTQFLSTYGLSWGIAADSSYHVYRVLSATTTSCIFLPSRPLAKSPEVTFTSTGSLVTSLNGVSYKTSYGHHKTWSLSLYLDGALDAGRPEFYWDAMATFDNWLKLADNGVTVTLQRRDSTTFYSRALRTTAPYIDCPTNICGQLEQASLRFEGADQHCYRYKLDLTIHEAKGSNMYE